MAQYRNITESGVISTRPGYIKGFVVNTHSSGTLKLIDGTEPSVAASSVITSAGACAPAYHAQNVLTSSGAMVAGTHAVSVLTGSSNFSDAVAASLTLTNDQTNVTAGDTVTLNSVVYTFRSAANMAASTDVLLGATAAASVLNLLAKLNQDADTTSVLTSTYVITTTAKVAGTGGNSITCDENSTHLAWAGGATALAGGLAAETITIGAKVYTFKTTVQEAYQVAIGSTLTLSLVNLYNAINGVYPPAGYNFSTPAHTQVVAVASDATTITIRGRVPGTSLNTVATTETCANASWPDTTLGGGTGASDPGVTTGAATVTIGSTVYTVVDALSETYGATAVAYQVVKGANEAAMIANLAKAINGTGTAGTEYSTGTVAHTVFVCSTSDATTLTIRSRLMGTAAQVAVINALATTETMANTAWADTTCGGGTGNANPAVTSDAATFTINSRKYTAVLELSETLNAAAVADEVLWTSDEKTFLDNVKKAINASGTAGTDYSTGTTRNLDVVATTNTDTQQTIVSKKLGTIGNAITTTTTLANYSWTSTVLASGTGATGRVLFNTITFPAVTVGPLTWEFPEEVSLDYGLYATIGGTADITIQYN